MALAIKKCVLLKILIKIPFCDIFLEHTMNDLNARLPLGDPKAGCLGLQRPQRTGLPNQDIGTF